ncbi:MAG TPA: 2,3-bisphosphoglycerate-dependent phosphoglycerate mutase [Marinagarivorans sp.]
MNNTVKDVVMIRHAQSTWNAQVRFTGWANPPLTDNGIAEAHSAAALLKAAGYRFDAVYNSVLLRTQQTTQIILQDMGQQDVPVEADWRLNERHYGALQGKNKIEMANKVGEDQVWRWRRGFADLPPVLADDDPAHPKFDPLYTAVAPERLPSHENLAMTQTRVLEFWQERIVADLKSDRSVLISSHGNTLRALLMGLSDMTVEEVESFEIPTGTPIICEFNGDYRMTSWRYLKGTA